VVVLIWHSVGGVNRIHQQGIIARLAGDGAAACESVFEPGRGLHVDFVDAEATVTHSAYGGAAVVATASLVLGRRPRDDITLVGAVNLQGDLRRFYPPRSLMGADLMLCQAAGFSRLVLPHNVALDETAVAFVAEGRVDVLRLELLDEEILPLFFA
jgi:hypothetical protein